VGTKQNLGRDEAADGRADRLRHPLPDGALCTKAMMVRRRSPSRVCSMQWTSTPCGARARRRARFSLSLVEEDLRPHRKGRFRDQRPRNQQPPLRRGRGGVNETVHGDKSVAVVVGHQQAEALRTQLPTCTVVEGP